MGLSDLLDSARKGDSTPSQTNFASIARNAETMSIMSQASTVVDKNERDPEKDILQGMASLDVDNPKVVDDGRKIIVGVDFGTTFSGLAWAETRRSDHQTVIEQWPAKAGTQEGVSSVKVPSELRYTGDSYEWGFQIPAILERHKWFKLALADKSIPIEGLAGSRDANQLVKDYLSALHTHLLYTLTQSLGPSILRSTPLEFVLTVPAIWSDLAKSKTLEAFTNAVAASKSQVVTSRNPLITLVSEPEAAAIYALHGLDPHGLKVGDSFVLCDAGGGTVDLISYTIEALYPTLQIREAASGTGGLCGSTFLNRRFGDYLEGKLKKESGWDAEVLAEAMERFDSVIKKQFSPTLGDCYSIPVPGLRDNKKLGLRRGRFTMPSSDLKTIFLPVIQDVIELVQGQIANTSATADINIRAVLLVGGFGQNQYLKEELRRAVGPTIEVLQPPNAWTAVVRGAVMMGLARSDEGLAKVKIGERRARKHYGIELAVTFREEDHHFSEKYWCDRRRKWKAREMRWFIKRGAPVFEKLPTSIDFSQSFPVSAGRPRSAEMRLLHDPTSIEAPIHKNNNVTHLVSLKADLSLVPLSDFEKLVIVAEDGKNYYQLEGTVEMTCLSASTKYTLLFGGKRYDTVTAEYV